ncbi:ABC transporter ATP-binding protein [Pullulanibacillus sp. KACC 23026]|uniref:ATP-binding cassette domain-containing protein n=1 Tax=Pullulanibacillus sp. KACC 23026 TaxID=3028315 RepID=UPI0023AFA8FC|nr:ABC transporter ATP-binding protein [Pullulanibacillus sp. KACC 23026]WEG10907.1 ABC transporter ATP-binding protein [Pullulanibacillus sp. KACC 23026]
MERVAVQCSNLTKRYGRKKALDQLQLNIPTGKVAGILGSNGAGKSTLFRLMMGLVRPDEGELFIFGEKPGFQTNARIAYLPDRARWYADHTVKQAFQWGCQFLPGFDLSEANRFADQMKLDEEMKLGEMSKGQEARLQLILCLARHVPLMILDEPFSGIDTVSREQIIESLIDLMSEREQTLLISTHEIYEAEGLLDYAIFLEEGRVVLAEESEVLRQTYGSLHSIPRKLLK